MGARPHAVALKLETTDLVWYDHAAGGWRRKVAVRHWLLRPTKGFKLQRTDRYTGFAAGLPDRAPKGLRPGKTVHNRMLALPRAGESVTVGPQQPAAVSPTATPQRVSPTASSPSEYT